MSDTARFTLDRFHDLDALPILKCHQPGTKQENSNRRKTEYRKAIAMQKYVIDSGGRVAALYDD